MQLRDKKEEPKAAISKDWSYKELFDSCFNHFVRTGDITDGIERIIIIVELTALTALTALTEEKNLKFSIVVVSQDASILENVKLQFIERYESRSGENLEMELAPYKIDKFIIDKKGSTIEFVNSGNLHLDKEILKWDIPEYGQIVQIGYKN